MESSILCKEMYPAPECEIRKMVPERVMAASGSLSDDEYEFISW